MKLIRYTERPELWSNTIEITREVWPEYNLHGDVMNAYWGRLFEDFPGYQFVLYEDDVLAEGHTVPCTWDRTPDGLGEGIDTMLIAAFQAHEARRTPNALCALAAEIRPRFQGRGLARQILDAIRPGLGGIRSMDPRPSPARRHDRQTAATVLTGTAALAEL